MYFIELPLDIDLPDFANPVHNQEIMWQFELEEMDEDIKDRLDEAENPDDLRMK